MTVQEVIDDVLSPLIETDGGAIELVDQTDERIVVKLSKACVGCPGFDQTRDRVVIPALRKIVASSVTIVVLR